MQARVSRIGQYHKDVSGMNNKLISQISKYATDNVVGGSTIENVQLSHPTTPRQTRLATTYIYISIQLTLLTSLSLRSS